MQASDTPHGVKRGMKVEDDDLQRVFKKARNDAIPDPNPALLSPITDNLLRSQKTPSSAVQASPSYVVHSFPAPAPLDVTGSPPYAYFVWNVQPRATTTARKRKSPSCYISSRGTPISTTDKGPGQACVSASSPVLSTAASTSSGDPLDPHTAAVPGPSIPNQLEPQLEHRHAALLARLDTQYAALLGEDARRRAAFQEAAFARAVEIDVEERWARDLKQMVLSTISPLVPSAPSLTALVSSSSSSLSYLSSSTSSSSSPVSGLAVLPLTTSPIEPPQYGRLLHTHTHTHNHNHNHQYAPCSDEQQRERAYLYQVIGHTDQHISALRDAQRMAFEREATEAHLAERALQELQARKQKLVADRTLEVQSAGAALGM